MVLARADYSAGRAAEARGDRARALIEYVAAADTDPHAALALARLYDSGDGAGDAEQALRWLRRAGDLGDAHAQYRVGLRYLLGWGAARREPREAALWFERAAQRGHAGARFELGRLLASGPVAQPERARELIAQAADAGEPEAQRWLGRDIERSDTVRAEPPPERERRDPAARSDLPRYWDEDAPRVTLHWGIHQRFGHGGWSLWDPYPWYPYSWYPYSWYPYSWYPYPSYPRGTSPWAWGPHPCEGGWCGPYRQRHGGVYFGIGIAN